MSAQIEEEPVENSRWGEEHLNRKLIPLTQWNNHHPWPPPGGLRHLVFHSKTNGFEGVFKRCGRRILIDEKKFFEYIERRNQEKQ